MNNTEKLEQAISRGLAIPTEAITGDLSYQSISEWDSMAHMILVSEIEQAFDIRIGTKDILEMTDLENIRRVLNRHAISFN